MIRRRPIRARHALARTRSSCEGTPVITKDGWYRFVFVFSDTDGYAYLTESVRSEAIGRQVATSGPEPVGGGSPEKISSWGGPGYFWLPTRTTAACRWLTSPFSSGSTADNGVDPWRPGGHD